MLGRLAGNVCVRVTTNKTRSSRGATRGHSSGFGDRGDPPGGAFDRLSFEYLLTTAKIESNFNPSAQASTSSAKGLYQFIDQNWLGTMKQDRAALGLGRYADAIDRQRDGRYAVSDPKMRAEILRLRSDPQASAMVAGALTRNNSTLVSGSIGRQPTNGVL
jgi:hypothetical protein